MGVVRNKINKNEVEQISIEQEETVNIYGSPIPADTKIGHLVYENDSHTGPFKGAVDIGLEVRTPVLAPLKGKVIRVRDDSDQYGQDKKYSKLGNVINIKHKHGEISELIHLEKGSALVRVGDDVEEGQQLAVTGLSGWMSAPHLHWLVFKRIPEDPKFKGLKIRLKRPLEEFV